MSFSLFLTHCFFWSIAVLLLIPLLKKINFLVYKNGIPLLLTLFVIISKLIIVYEFPFTKTVPSKIILPMIDNIFQLKILYSISILQIFLFIWITISMCLIFNCIYCNSKLKKMVAHINESDDDELKNILYRFKGKNNRIPKIIKTNFCVSPFIIGFKSPIIVIPENLNRDEFKYVIFHELEHYKHNHILIKIFIEYLVALHWWNPIIWIFRKEVIKALELQTDTYVIEQLSKKESLSYLETLIKLTKKSYEKSKIAFSLSFSNEYSLVEYRIFSVLNQINNINNKTVNIFYKLIALLCCIFIMIPFFYTFEKYSINDRDVVGTFEIYKKESYFIKNKNNTYDLYIDDKYLKNFKSIPKDLNHLPIL